VFNQLVVSGVQGRTHKPWTVAMSAAVESLLLGMLILIPQVYTEILPKTILRRLLLAPAQPPKDVVVSMPSAVERSHFAISANNIVPGIKRRAIEPAPDQQPAPYDNVFLDSTSDNTKLLTTLTSPGPAPAAPSPAAPSRIRLTSNVESASIIRKVIPEYPVTAILARISGKVVLHAIIAKDGTVQELQYVSGPPLLVAAAINAVKQWRYKPTMLNGEPVEVATTIDVVFSLGS
jgi:protein TonB